MPRFKKSRPLGVCNVCGALTEAHADVNHRCREVRIGRRCSGTYKATLGMVWSECPGCHAYGKIGSQACTECAGFGWKRIA